MGAGSRRRTAGRMAAQIPIVAATSTPTIARNSKKRPASPSHNGSGGGYGTSKKKKLSASSFTQVRCPHGPGTTAHAQAQEASRTHAQGGAEAAARAQSSGMVLVGRCGSVPQENVGIPGGN